MVIAMVVIAVVLLFLNWSGWNAVWVSATFGKIAPQPFKSNTKLKRVLFSSIA